MSEPEEVYPIILNFRKTQVEQLTNIAEHLGCTLETLLYLLIAYGTQNFHTFVAFMQGIAVLQQHRDGQ